MHPKSFIHYLSAILLLVIGLLVPSNSLAQEPSPIEIELVVPSQAGPGQLIDVLIKYNATDVNAGANINYNVSGPCRIWTRDPEPPNPIVNTWSPTAGNAQGTIKIQLQIEEGADGKVIQHLVEVRWGSKYRKFEATTQIKYVPPTATPTPTPRSTRVQPKPTQPPTPTVPPSPTQAALALISATFVDAQGQALETSQANQDMALDILYTSSAELANVSVIVRFEPDVVNVDGAEYANGSYTLTLPTLAAAMDKASLFAAPLRCHIRPYADGGEEYDLKAVVQIISQEGTVAQAPDAVNSSPVRVSQPMLLAVNAEVEAQVIKTGGSIIIHAICENSGVAPIKWFTLHVAGLPEGFSVSPEQQTIDELAGNDGSQAANHTTERLFTIHAPDTYSGTITFKVTAIVEQPAAGQTTVESPLVTIELAPPARLDLDVVASKSEVRAGDLFYVNVICTNNGRFAAEGVTAKLIDVTGNLGVLFQDLGDIGPGESRQTVFVVEIPSDWAADMAASLAVQAVATDGTLGQSQAFPVAVSCVPAIHIQIQSPAGNVSGGQPVDIIVSMSNPRQCLARDILISLDGLPDGFAAVPSQTVSELAGGATRHLTFSIAIPEGYQGSVPFQVRALLTGEQAKIIDGAISVGGVPIAFTIVFGLLAVVAVVAIIVGLVLYFRNRQAR